MLGYTRIIQSGEYVEIYQYQKKINVSRRKRCYRKNKRKKKKQDDHGTSNKYRSIRSIRRARESFFRLVDENLYRNKKPVFITLTCYQELSLEHGYQALRLFWQKIRKQYPDVKYIVVPEWQKRGVLHFHALVWGIDHSDAEKERTTRNYQRSWGRGFVDLLVAYDNSQRIAGYMAKYLVKTLEDRRLRNQRAFSCSRNIDRPRSTGSNQLSNEVALVLPDKRTIAITKQYDTLVLGQCDYIKYKIINYD